MRIFISGACGFIGSNLFNECSRRGLDVTGVDDLSGGHVEFVDDMSRVILSDFASDSVLLRVLRQKFDVVVHLAALPRVSYSVEHPLETNETNVTKTLQLIDACRGNIKRFVFASSSSVYGGADVLPTPETHPKDPKSPYALQKSVVEDYLTLYERYHGLDSASLRFFNVFGPCQLGGTPYSTAVSSWLTTIKQGKLMRSDGDGTQTRDMCYVDNVVDACLRAASTDAPLSAGRFNIACGDSVSNNEILNALRARYHLAEKTDAPWRAGDVMHTLADVSRAREVLGYLPTVDVWEGVKRTCEWYDESWDRIRSLL